LKVVRTLHQAGHVALLAGGCVRDMLLGQAPQDYDVATDARPDDVQRLFRRCRAVGRKFGVVLVRVYRHDVEVATFRSDHSYSDGRRPDRVEFTDARQDALRRDFTINGMFLDPLSDRVIDYVGGQADLAAGVIRTIGDARERFREDHLRLLRAVRFAARLGFELEPATLSAMQAEAASLGGISAERVWMELEKIITDRSRARGWELLTLAGLHHYLAEGWDWTEEQARQSGALLDRLPLHAVDAPLALAALVSDRPPSAVIPLSEALRLSNDCADRTRRLLQHLPKMRRPSAWEEADVRLAAADPDRALLIDLARAELSARAAEGARASGVAGAERGAPSEGGAAAAETGAERDAAAGGGEEDIRRFERLAARILAWDPAAATPPPLLTGDDLIAAGHTPGPAFRPALDAAYRAQLNGEVASAAEALARARSVLDAG